MSDELVTPRDPCRAELSQRRDARPLVVRAECLGMARGAAESREATREGAATGDHAGDFWSRRAQALSLCMGAEHLCTGRVA